jgi:hypothetical protein
MDPAPPVHPRRPLEGEAPRRLGGGPKTAGREARSAPRAARCAHSNALRVKEAAALNRALPVDLDALGPG